MQTHERTDMLNPMSELLRLFVANAQYHQSFHAT
jgi:hypothetical protein